MGIDGPGQEAFRMTVTDRLMKEFLRAMPNEPFTTRQLSRLMNRNDNNVRRTLSAMQDLGIVRREDVGRNRYVWKKLVTV